MMAARLATRRRQGSLWRAVTVVLLAATSCTLAEPLEGFAGPAAADGGGAGDAGGADGGGAVTAGGGGIPGKDSGKDSGPNPCDSIQSCQTGKPGVCADGLTACVKDKVVCQPKTAASTEKCNLLDDDCNDKCDDGAGCRSGVHRSYSTSKDAHLLSTSLSEAQSNSYALEVENVFYLYKTALPGMNLFNKCLKANGRYFYTTSSLCEGQGTKQGSLGYIGSMSTPCQSVPLYRVYHSGTGNHFYTTSTAERDYTLTLGYVSQGVAGHVWLTP
ncbi:MAG: hypothetical protein R3B13_07100 [Polyangiaceae bacterium]